MNHLKHFIFIPICLLTACAPHRFNLEQEQLTPVNKVRTIQQHQEQAKTVTSWEIQGAMAAKNKSKGWSAAMNWIQNGANSYQIRLMGPLGSGTVLINKKENTVTFQDGTKKITSTNANELLLQQTGIRLPVHNLYYWMRGLPAPGTPELKQHDQYNHIILLKQSGYTINFGKYTSVKGIELPKMIRLEGNGVMVKVLIKNWAI